MKILDKYRLGTTTNPTTPLQPQEFNQKIWEGATAIEFGALQPQVLESIPKQYYEEIAHLAKINNVKPSFHAPVSVPWEGIDRHGRVSEEARKFAEHVLKLALERAKDVGEKYGEAIKVNIHAPEHYGAREWDPNIEKKAQEKLKDKAKSYYLAKQDLIVNLLNNRVEGVVQVEILKTPFGEEVKTLYDWKKELNERVWKENLSTLTLGLERLKQDLQAVAKFAGEALYDPSKSGLFYNAVSHIDVNFYALEEQMKRIYNAIEKYGTPEQKKYLKERLEKIMNQLKELKNKYEQYKREVQRLAQEGIRQPVEKYKELAKWIFNNMLTLNYYRFKLLENVANEIGKMSALYGPPEIIKLGSEFAIESGSETIAKTYEKFLRENIDKWKYIPTLVIENPPAEYGESGGSLVSRAEELKEFIEKIKQKLYNDLKNDREFKKRIEELIKKDKEFREKYGKNPDEAIRKLIDEKIGVTWDVAHISYLMWKGYPKEKIIEETERVKDLVKHIHIADSYGLYDVHLVPGQAGLKDIIKEALEKLGKKDIISEAGGWYQQRAQSNQYGITLPSHMEEIWRLADELGISEISATNPLNLPYSEVLWYYPTYGISALYTMPPFYNLYTPATLTEVTRYHPYGTNVFSALPTELGGSAPQQTFTGLPRE